MRIRTTRRTLTRAIRACYRSNTMRLVWVSYRF